MNESTVNSNEKMVGLVVDGQNKIGVVQQEFHKAFPFLKVEFFSRTHQTGRGSARRYLLHGEHSQNLSGVDSDDLAITADMTVAEVEQLFQQHFGMGAQIFRKSGNVWLETTVTDGWTLEEQNRQGEALSKALT